MKQRLDVDPKQEREPTKPEQVYQEFKQRVEVDGLELQIEEPRTTIGTMYGKDDVRFILRFKKQKKDLGQIDFTYHKKTDHMQGHFLYGKKRGEGPEAEADAWKPEGIGTALIALSLIRYPETKTITTSTKDKESMKKMLERNGFTKFADDPENETVLIATKE